MSKNTKHQKSLCGAAVQLDASTVIEPQVSGQSFGRIDVGVVVKQLLENPIEFPPIGQAIIPGDTVAIALSGPPAAIQPILDVVISFLLSHQVDAQNITVVSTLSHEWSDRVRCKVHSDNDLAYLCATLDGHGVYVNRDLFESDQVISISAINGAADLDPVGTNFCGGETRNLLAEKRPTSAQDPADRINDYLGVFWAIQAVLGPGSVVRDVFLGERKKVSESARRMAQDVWQLSIDDQVDLVIATLETDEEQSWGNASRAILSADSVVIDDGAIVLCSRLDGRPAVWLDDESSGESTKTELADVFRRRHVYLLSQLSQEDTEDLGFGYVESSKQLNRLVGQRQSCLLLRDAHKVHVAVSSLSAEIV